MSKVHFHSPHGDEGISGAERYHLARLTTHLTWPIIEPYANELRAKTPPLLEVLPEDCYLRRLNWEGLQRLDAFRTWFGCGGNYLLINQEKWGLFELQLNTLCRMGNDQLRLAARLHGQCEIHAWVDGPNRAWLARIMEKGRATGVYRADVGWKSVIDLLRSRSDEPVVTSYSVCRQFPNADIAGWMQREEIKTRLADDEANYDDLYEKWYCLPASDQWGMAMEGLRFDPPGNGLELTPEGWNEYYFGDGKTLFDVAIYLDSLRELSEE